MRRDISSEEFGITKCTLTIVWSDGRTEDLSPALPEYLAKEIEIYLDELEDLRNCDPEDYNFSEVDHV